MKMNIKILNKIKIYLCKPSISFNFFFVGFKKLILLVIVIVIIYLENFNVIKLIYHHKINNKYIISREKKKLLLFLSQRLKKNITKIEVIFLNFPSRFGNLMILLNKAIFYCEILKCKRMILNKHIYWFITNNTIDTNNNMIIELGDINNYQNKSNILIDNTNNYFWYCEYYRPQYRINIFKDQLLQNLPKIIVNPNDLQIYVRSGDIFGKTSSSLGLYFQPPLCFYKNILNNFKFENIYIISENKNNPIIDQILIQYPNTKYNVNSLKYDMSILINAYNIVGAYSTFLKVLILLNDNLQKFWYFNYQSDLLWSYFFSYEFSHKNLSLIKMKEYDFYKRMIDCKNLQCQKNIMINYTCKYPFKIIN